MTTPLLTTKLHIPPLRQDNVPRPDLIEWLNEGLHYEFTLIPSLSFFVSRFLLFYNVPYSTMLSIQTAGEG